MVSAKEEFWDNLLSFMEDGRVIPLIGRDLLVVPGENGPTDLYRLIADRLAAELNIATDPLPPDYSLSHVVCAYPDFRERRQSIYPRLKRILDSLLPKLPIPEPLIKLAGISAFNLFVSTTFDPFLERAINQVRFQGKPNTSVITFSPNVNKDLPADFDKEKAMVFQLMGRVSALTDYAVTDADTLEFVHTLQSVSTRPQRLFDELRQSYLLILGTSFPDWLARFFLRLAKSEKLWTPRDKREIFVDQKKADHGFVAFLTKFSSESEVYEGTCSEFVDTLAEKWARAHPGAPAASATPAPVPIFAPPPEPEVLRMEPNSIFISYASQDRPAAMELYDTLKKENLDVWLDRDKLLAGDDYEKKIKRNIRRCSVFLPIISKTTEDRLEGFFRREWFWAVERLQEFTGCDRSFLVPVVIDDTLPYSASVPDEFEKAQWVTAPDGKISKEAVDALRLIHRSARKSERSVV